MWVCMCEGVTSHTVQEAISAGARTTRDVAKVCKAGSACGRCKHTIRTMIAASSALPPPKQTRRRWLR
jgi:bacterioferritin-associated ferredoxin